MGRRRSRQRRNNHPAPQPNSFPEHTANFRDLSLYPEKEDIYSKQPKLCPVKTKGSYRNTEHYLDAHFKVLREDFISPLRQAIKRYREQCQVSNESFKISNIEIYKNVRFVSNNKVCFDVKDEIRGVDWASTKRFMIGSLLMFTYDNFQSFFLATVAHTDTNELKRKFITVDLVDKDQYEKFVVNKNFTMIESESFFTPYYHVLKALHELEESSFPFKKYFVYVNLKLQPPSYLDSYTVYNIKSGMKQITFNILDDSKWPTASELGLDVSQFRALKAALTNELVVIQGPPGTGKTFIGIQIVEVLLANSHVWNQNMTPILVICFTNHALDQFLEGLLSLTNRLVRVGKNDGGKLQNFNLHERRRQCANRRQNEIATDLQILRSALVVGTTTTLAAKQRQLFEFLAPKIVIVEEAAEVLEAHIVASLSTKCQHLIMIGDHKQLRPKVEIQSAQQYKLDVSLFERLIQNGMPHQMLLSQHRMRPEISQLLVRTIYPNLQNHPSVLRRETIKGMDKNVFFMTHDSLEEEADSTSKKNEFETMLLLNLAKYLVKQGYKPQEITILATYKGQSNYMEQKRKGCGLPSEIQITTVDSFQGEENKIILLSLVRSNPKNDVGYLKTENRICVALSRARDGFYIVGNMNCLVARSHTWTVIRDSLTEQQSYGPSLLLRCQVHKDQITRISCPGDFTPVSHGGCRLPCGQKLSCGHICSSKQCHGPLVRQNVHQRCMEPCPRSCPRGHRCSKKCSQPCDRCPCQIIVQQNHSIQSVESLPRVQYVPRVITDNTIRKEEERPKKCCWCTLL